MPHEILLILQQLPILAALLLVCGAALKPALDRRLTPANRRHGWLLVAVFLLIFLLDLVRAVLQLGVNRLIGEWNMSLEIYFWINSGLGLATLLLFVLAGVILLLFRPAPGSVTGGVS